MPSEDDLHSLKVDLYKARAEDFKANFESLRTVEWHVTTQTFAGYAAIAIGFSTLHEKVGASTTLMVGAIAATVVLFLVTLYLSLRLQERLHSTRDNMNAYFDELHRLLGAEQFEKLALQRRVAPKAGGLRSRLRQLASATPIYWFRQHKPPIHGRWYAFAAQLTISLAWAVGLLLYIISLSADP